MKELKILIIGWGKVGRASFQTLRHLGVVSAFDADPAVRKNAAQEGCSAESSLGAALNKCDIVMVCVSASQSLRTNQIDTSVIKEIVATARGFPNVKDIVVRSTVPIGTLDRLASTPNTPIPNIIYWPEFSTEADLLKGHLSRVVVGCKNSNQSTPFLELVSKMEAYGTQVKRVGFAAAETIKLATNGFLSVKLAYLNELRALVEAQEISADEVFTGLALDVRIGSEYSNPSFGFGGQCLEKDASQLDVHLSKDNSSLVGAAVASNLRLRDQIAEQLHAKTKGQIGFYRLTWHSRAKDFTNSAQLDIAKKLASLGRRLIIFEPDWIGETPAGLKMVEDLDTFTRLSDTIVANRVDPTLTGVSEKVFTYDVFGTN